MSRSINPAAIGCILTGNGRRYSDGYTWPEQLRITSKSTAYSYNYSSEGSPSLSINYFSNCEGYQVKVENAYDAITGSSGKILNGFMNQIWRRTASTPSVIEIGSYDAAVAALSAALSAAPYILVENLVYNFGLCRCPDGSTPSPYIEPYIFRGTAAPPPPPPKNMNCCDCNMIATIIADQMAEQLRLFESIKDHIDLRTKEEIQIYRKQLEALEIDLQPILDRLNEVERNLWNGIPK